MAYSNEQEVSRGNQAKLLLENPMFDDAFKSIESEIMAAWESTSTRDTEGREKLFQMLMLSRKVRRHFESLINTGEMARRTLADVVRRERL